MITSPNDHIPKQFDSVELEMSCTKLCIYLTLVKKEKLFSSFYCITGVGNYRSIGWFHFPPSKCRERLSLNCMCKTKLSTVKDPNYYDYKKIIV